MSSCRPVGKVGIAFYNGCMATLFKDFRLLTMCDNGRPYGAVDDWEILVGDGKIKSIGDSEKLLLLADETDVIHGHGRFLTPGLIDCHTHLVYGGSRADEWEMRLNGVAYEEIARRGGGILATVAATRMASEDELYETSSRRLNFLMRQGVTAFEIKTGYGLDLATELKMLRVINRLNDELPVHVSRTLLAAHAVPPEFTGKADEYVNLVCHEIIPAAAKLCDAVDVFCESIAFDLDQTRRVFEAAQKTNCDLGLKVHAEQLTHTGAAALAASMGAMSADHLEHLTAADCYAMAEAGTVATLLPGAFYNLKEQQKPPLETLRELDVPIAIATDANPGSSPVSSILLMAHMACTFFGLTPEAAIRGLTANAARALRLDETMGTLEVGKNADFAVWNIESAAELAYGIGHNPCVEIYIGGKRLPS